MGGSGRTGRHSRFFLAKFNFYENREANRLASLASYVRRDETACYYHYFWVRGFWRPRFYGIFPSRVLRPRFSGGLGGCLRAVSAPKTAGPGPKPPQSRLPTVLARSRRSPDAGAAGDRPKNDAGVAARAFEPQNGWPVTYNRAGGANRRETGAASLEAGGLRVVRAAQGGTADFFGEIQLLRK